MYIQLLKKCLLDNIYDSIVMANHIEGGSNPGEKASDHQISIGAYSIEPKFIFKKLIFL